MRLSNFLSRFHPVALALALGCAAPQVAQAVTPFQIADIRIEGLARTDAGSVFSALPFRTGDNYTDEKAVVALRALFASGHFKDVRIDVEGPVVVVVVQERPIIAHVDFVGAKEFDRDTLIRSLKDVGVADGMPFDRAQADRAEQEIKRQYLTRSLYGAEVVTTITPIEKNQVNVSFSVTEGGVARIRDIHITGNQAFSEVELIDQLDLTPGGLMTWYTKSDRYSQTKLNADRETLRSFYLNRGYLEFDIASSQVAISPDKQDIGITINVKEGQHYTVTGVKLTGDYLGQDEAFGALVSIRPGQAYRLDDVAATIRAFNERFGLFGYAFARIEALPQVDRKTGQVVMTLHADPGRRAYVRRIQISGNTRTRDEVIRREVRQFESAWYDGRRIRLSRDRIDRLGYFSQVDVEQQEVPGSPDEVDLTFTVKEKPNGSMMIGATYSTADHLGFNASVRQDNIFGSGNYFGIDFNTTTATRMLNFSSVDPYFTEDGVSRSFDMYYRTNKPINSQGEQYKLVTIGGSVRFGVPVTELDKVFLGGGLERTDILASSALPEYYFRYRADYGTSSVTVPLTLGWQRDGRDNAMAPNSGTYQRVNLELGAFGDARYFRSNAQIQQFWPFTKTVTLGVNAEMGYGVGLMNRPYPVFKNFYAGGLGTVRSFDQNSLGPVDVTGAYIGGSRRLNLNSELYVPFPGVGHDRSLRIFGYADAGNVWNETENLQLSSLRASVGVGLSWMSPVGPLKFSYGKPVRYFPQDKIQNFQFQMGTAF
ncbi:MAG: outer membrane protein assembly factor BamA [Leptothrix ochracea]|uniref:outer membrane protein assembly factor BamA n=1 Tax=Leptothrix ochracea TaxID=735331 RepID=UPI0034E1ADF6